MKRRQFVNTLGLSGLSLAALSSFTWKELMVEFQIREVRDGVFVYTNRGGTIMFQQSDAGWIVVDTQFPDQSKELVAELKNRAAAPIGLLINTHHHGDHSSGNIVYKDWAKDLVAHENSLKNQKASTKGKEDSQWYPTITYTDKWTKKIGGKEISLTYLGAGHTDGDSWVHFEDANVVHTGDLLFNRRSPYVDKSAGANVSSWIEVLEKAQAKFDNDTKFVFGHCADGYDIIGSKADLKAFQRYLSQSYDMVKKKLASGVSGDDIKALKAYDFQTEWGTDGMERIMSALVQELS